MGEELHSINCLNCNSNEWKVSMRSRDLVLECAKCNASVAFKILRKVRESENVHDVTKEMVCELVALSEKYDLPPLIFVNYAVLGSFAKIIERTIPLQAIFELEGVLKRHDSFVKKLAEKESEEGSLFYVS